MTQAELISPTNENNIDGVIIHVLPLSAVDRVL
jgi:hypothetical protein